jgi:hypothetical protein
VTETLTLTNISAVIIDTDGREFRTALNEDGELVIIDLDR